MFHWFVFSVIFVVVLTFSTQDFLHWHSQPYLSSVAPHALRVQPMHHYFCMHILQLLGFIVLEQVFAPLYK
jgi:hypothetical protein